MAVCEAWGRGRGLRLVAVAALSTSLAACSTLSKEECQTADWSAIGERDGAAGYVEHTRLAGHAKACAKVGISPDQALWRAGYASGLSRYCTASNGLRVGESGGSYGGVCGLDAEVGFLAAFDVGERLYRARTDLDQAKRSVADKQDQVTELLQSFGDLSEAERLAAHYDIAELNDDILDHQEDILKFSRELVLAEEAVATYRATLAQPGS